MRWADKTPEQLMRDLRAVVNHAPVTTDGPGLFMIPPSNYYTWAYPAVRFKPRIKGQRRVRRRKL